jgi:hypothetical protein
MSIPGIEDPPWEVELPQAASNAVVSTAVAHRMERERLEARMGKKSLLIYSDARTGAQEW